MLKARLKKKSVINFIKNKKIEKQMRLADMGRTLGVSSGYWSQILNGTRHPSPALQKKILSLMGVTVEKWGVVFSPVNKTPKN